MGITLTSRTDFSSGWIQTYEASRHLFLYRNKLPLENVIKGEVSDEII
jgi:hypothetical protein